MLYKKIHRQYLRQFRLGRWFKIDGYVDEVTGKPYIKRSCYIWVGNWKVINTVSGQLWHEDEITWPD